MKFIFFLKSRLFLPYSVVLWVTCHYGSRGSSAIVASCLCCCFEGPKFFLADISWVKRFSKGYFAGPTFFLVGILWVENFFLVGTSWISRVFRGSKSFSPGYFVGPNFFLVGTSWIQSSSRGSFVVQKFFSWLFRGSKFFSRGYFVGPKFFAVGISWFKDFQFLAAWEWVTENRNT